MAIYGIRALRFAFAYALTLAGSASVGAAPPVQQPAPATCSAQHVNVEAYDAGGGSSFGTKGYIYVNTQATLTGLHGAIARTFLLWSPSATSNVEFGWADYNGGYTVPTVASDYMVAGLTQPPSFWPGFALGYNTGVRFRIENVGDKGIFRYLVDGQSTPIAYSPTMTFNDGWPATNSEHYNSCDTLWTRMSGLADQITLTPGWSTSYFDLECQSNDSVNDWLLYKVSNSDLEVDQTFGWGYHCS